MQEMIEKLARARQIKAAYQGQLEVLKKEIDAEIEDRFGFYLGQLEQALETAKIDVADAEAAIRSAALDTFNEMGDKHPHPAVVIREMTRLEYDYSDAFRYCVDHLQTALKMDRRKFERVAKVADLAFVDIHKKPQATIARDLSTYVGKQGGQG